MRPSLRLCGGTLLLALAACASPPPPLPEAQVLIFGEQHDQPDHQRQTARAVVELGSHGRLAALVIEMAEHGHNTTGVPRDADAARVRETLGWSGWEWPVYEGVVMAAVRAGVPVLGGNLPRAALRETMADASRDALLDAGARERLTEAVREGHCGLLPAEQEPGMVRVQIGRDQSLAATVTEALRPGQQVILLTGAQHASRDRGVPLHLARLAHAPSVHVLIFGEQGHDLAADELRAARFTPRPDPCEGLAEKLRKGSRSG
ncbi:MAG: ChaN family lipoprotein [Piscinibacter sp.]|uniref:ChaN family lipoprotein n=1 Tax=Piscinibacter sp. TaxID=1903157 RepID=UPI001B547541|nr:ChaN family lipoprotein [Piscinibacter sp.]MBP5988857.1 ChaN family lipoprotein [Piscinibacter sp.]MBP6026423.1 ChaN family lipoprotein [Piscinibacter sp.]